MSVRSRALRSLRHGVASLLNRFQRWIDPAKPPQPGSSNNDETGTSARPAAPVATDGGSLDADIELVVAIIRPGKLNDVKQALAAAAAPSLTVTNVSGRGTQPDATGEWHGEEYIVDLHQKIKIECAVVADRTDTVVDALQEAATTGQPGDGKIFVLPVYEACRVSTNERGQAAM